MASDRTIEDLRPPLDVVNGINLADYFPYKRSCNTVLYVHKKFLAVPEENPPRIHTEYVKTFITQAKKIEREKVKKKKKKKKNMLDKSIQFNGEVENDTWKDNKTYKIGMSKDSILEQTIKFAKNLVPLTMPYSRDRSPPVFYTVEATKVKRKKPQKNHDFSQQTHDVTFKKEKSQKFIETYRNEKLSQREESFSVKETFSYGSQNNTLDELQINPSLCCSLSEITDKKQSKRERSEKKSKRNDFLKFVGSESFEALATELVSKCGDAKVKIHLMNDTDKNLLSDTIRIPVINAIKECISELNNHKDIHNEIVTVQKYIKCNTQKLDNILEKVTDIERKLDEHINERIKEHVKEYTKALPKPAAVTPSTLETLGKDLIEVQESSEEECYQENLYERIKARCKSAVVQLTPQVNEETLTIDKIGDVACGEDSAPVNPSAGGLGSKPARLPARFCWTEGGRKSNA